MTLQERKKAMNEYIQVKISERDWHGVADASMDLRDLELEDLFMQRINVRENALLVHQQKIKELEKKIEEIQSSEFQQKQNEAEVKILNNAITTHSDQKRKWMDLHREHVLRIILWRGLLVEHINKNKRAKDYKTGGAFQKVREAIHGMNDVLQREEELQKKLKLNVNCL